MPALIARAMRFHPFLVTFLTLARGWGASLSDAVRRAGESEGLPPPESTKRQPFEAVMIVNRIELVHWVGQTADAKQVGWRAAPDFQCSRGPSCCFPLAVKERWTPKTGPLVKIDFRRSAGTERKQTHESKTQTA